jgi:hypothetical protein
MATKTTKLIKENYKDVVEVTIPQDDRIIRYPRYELTSLIEQEQAMVDNHQAKLDEYLAYQALLPKEVIKEVVEEPILDIIK